MTGGYGLGWRHRRVYFATGIPGYGRGRCWTRPLPIQPGQLRPGGLAPRTMGNRDELRMLEEEEQFLTQELRLVRDRLQTLSKGEDAE